jgi:hypothetical protein
MYVRWRDREGEGQAQGIDQQVALAAFDTCVGLIAADTTGLFDGLYGLGIHAGRSRIRVSADPPALSLP